MALIGFLKQSTTTTISLGPCLDDDDALTEKTGLTIEDTDIYLSKNGAAKANPSDTNDCTEDANGVYRKQLDTTDTGTLGRLAVYCHYTDVLYLRQDYAILPANIWDSFFSTDKLQVDLTQIDGNATNGTNATLNLKRLNIDNNGAAGAGIYVRGGTNAAGMQLDGQGSGNGLVASGGTTGNGIYARGGSSSGAGIKGQALAGNDNGMTLTKHGTGKDIDADEIDALLADIQSGVVIGAGYCGDYKQGATVRIPWGTLVAADTAGTIYVYKDNSTSECTAPTGITDSSYRNFDSRTNFHICQIDTSANSFYAPNTNYHVVVVGMVEGGNTINAVIGSFSIENRFAGIEYLKNG